VEAVPFNTGFIVGFSSPTKPYLLQEVAFFSQRVFIVVESPLRSILSLGIFGASGFAVSTLGG
jgi:hypothetical protein